MKTLTYTRRKTVFLFFYREQTYGLYNARCLASLILHRYTRMFPQSVNCILGTVHMLKGLEHEIIIVVKW